MAITRSETVDVVMPKDDPTWRFALGARPESTGLALRLEDADRTVGYGYCTEIAHLGYDLLAIRKTVEAASRRLHGADPDDGVVADVLAEARRTSPPAAAAVEMAVLDLRSRRAGVPMHELFGARVRDGVPVMRILSLKSPEKTALNAKARVAEGYRYLKIKLDNEDPGLDASRVVAVRSAVGPDVHLILDANQSYSVTEALAFYPRVHDQDVDIFEQPVPENDFAGLARLTRELPVTVDADESARSLDAVTELAVTGAVDSVSLKILKLGGPGALRAAVERCRENGVRFRMGAHVGSRLLNSVALHLAVTLDDLFYAAELGEFERLRNDPFEGIDVDNGWLHVPAGPGSGVRRKEANEDESNDAPY